MRINRKLLALSLALAVAVVPARATITLQLEAYQILQGGSSSASAQDGSMVLLVADTTGGGFGALQAGNIAVGSTINSGHNDLVVDQLTITSPIFTGLQPALYASPLLTLFGSWDAGDPLAIYWIPSLTTGDSNVGTSVAYGKYTDATGIDGSAAWITPTNGGTGQPMYFTTQAPILGLISQPASVGYSSLSTVAAIPEPSDFGLLGGASVLGLAFLRRRKTA
jgi:hypothetical protein